jgi:hypothetical protein
MRVARIVLMRLMLVLMSGMSSAFERGTFADRRGSGDNRGPEISEHDHQREQTVQEFHQHAMSLSRDTGTIKRVEPF